MLRNLTRALVGLGLAGLPLMAAAQEKKKASDGPINWTEVRFHRVHLKNGNFIDGSLVRKDNRMVVLHMKSGDFAIRADMVNRVEFMKVRSLHEAPPIVPLRNEAPPEIPAIAASTPPDSAAPPVVLTSDAPEALKALAESISAEKAADRRAKLAEILEKKGAEGPAFVAALLERVTEPARRDIVDLLLEKKASSALPVLLKLLKNSNPHVREQSLRAIEGVGEEGIVDQIEFCLSDPSPSVRAEALKVFMTLGDVDVFDRVGQMLRDADATVRVTALSALSALSNRHKAKEKFVETLRAELSNVSTEIMVPILTALGKIKEKAIAEEVAPYVEHAEPLVRATAIKAVVECDPSMAAKMIVERFGVEAQYAPRVQLAEGAKTLRLKACIEPLMEWLEDEDNNIQTAAATALRGITGQNFGIDPERWAAWYETTKPK